MDGCADDGWMDGWMYRWMCGQLVNSLSRQPEGWTNCCGASKIFSWLLHPAGHSPAHPSRHLCRGCPEEEEEEESSEAAGGGSSPCRSWRGRGREVLGKESTSESESPLYPSSWKEM